MEIAIITPSYNQWPFLEKTIQSVLNQKFEKLEYIIVDGGSGDESINIIKKYENRLAYWISEPDKGQSDAINKGFGLAKADWLCWVNSDDILLPNSINKVMDVIKRNNNMDIIIGNVIYIDEFDHIVKCIRIPNMKWSFYRRNVGWFSAPAVFFKRVLYEKVGGLDINLHYSMDIDLWHKFRLAGAKVYHIKDYLGAFRVHSSSKTGPRIKGERKYFEHPETTLIRKKYLPDVSENKVRFFRILYKLWQVINLNYLGGWLDLMKWRGKKWQEVFSNDKNQSTRD